MHRSTYSHQHELQQQDFLDCCLNCSRSLAIIRPHVLGFYERIKDLTPATLAALDAEQLYRTYQVLDDIAHLDVGNRLGELILADADIRRVLPAIRSYYATCLTLQEFLLAKEVLASASPWSVLEAFPFYPRYEALVSKQGEALRLSSGDVLAFIGCGPVPLSLILLQRLFGVRSIGLDTNPEAVSVARKCVAQLGLARGISLVHGDESRLWELPSSAILVAALAEPKLRIFRTLRAVLKEKGTMPVVYRTYTGIRAVLYRPVQPGEIEGFRIVRQIEPPRRVNNTLVFLELK